MVTGGCIKLSYQNITLRLILRKPCPRGLPDFLSPHSTYCEEIKNLPAYARLQKILIRDPQNKIGSWIKPNGVPFGLIQRRKKMLQTHFSGSINSEPMPYITINDYNNKTSGADWDKAKIHITQAKHKWAPAGDGIYPTLLHQRVDHLVHPLCTLFRANYALSYIPSMWRKSTDGKPGPKTYEQAKLQRRISLMSFILKTLENILGRQISDQFLPLIPLHDFQYAYQARKSCDLAIHEVVFRAQKAIQDKELAAATLNIEGSYDNTTFLEV